MARIPCRVCFTAVDLHPDFMERDDAGWVLRCPQCHRTFPVRDEDSAAALALLAPPAETFVSGSAASAASPGTVRVLIVDDDPDVRLLLHAVLTSPDVFVVGEANDGTDALAMVEQARPDVVVLDLMLPTLSGLDILPMLRRGHPGMRIVAVSAMATATAEPDALAAGADEFISKLDVAGRLLAAVTGRTPVGR